VAIITDSAVVFNGSVFFNVNGPGFNTGTVTWTSSAPFKMLKIVISNTPIVNPPLAVAGVFQEATSINVFAG
jgi:hypothetical protein